MHDAVIVLENEILKVELDAARPTVRRYAHKPSGEEMGGAGGAGALAVNGEPVPWRQWRIEVARDHACATYALSMPERGIGFEMAFALRDNALVFELKNVRDPKESLKTVGWENLPILTCQGRDYPFWRLFTTPPDPATGGKMWALEKSQAIGEAEPEAAPVPVIYGTLWNGSLSVFLDSNYPLFPQTHQVTAAGAYAISLNTYQYRVRSKTMPPLEAKVVFLGDINGDGRADVSDYRLWVNRKLPDGDPIYRDAIVYKILMNLQFLGVSTTIPQAEAIVRAIRNVTDGLPQIIYLVGLQEGGHDGDYPTLSSFNREFGALDDVRRLAAACKERYNAVLSCHSNIDDAYRRSRDWDDALVAPSGSPGQDALGVHGSMCHTLDVESGRLFERLQALLENYPVEKTLHFDNMRLTNTILHPGWERIGVLEELVCGLMPVMEWLRERGVTVTTEGYNGLPIDPSMLVSGFWHHDAPDGSRQIFHRKIVGGGRGDHCGQNTVADYGICNAIHRDITYEPISRESVAPDVWKERFHWLETPELTDSFRTDWPVIVDRIYRGVLLHHFYNEREMLAWDNVGDGWRITYADDVVAEVCIDSPESLNVTWGGVVVAAGDDRFIPRDGAIHAYSRDGCERDWVLPVIFRGRPLRVFTLSKEGRGPAPEYRLEKDRIRLKLAPRTPVKIVPE
ncbi:MAG TPA: endo-alpha-N-acetylgalactosaminidase family protein, partial [Sumerlaeia bacterium]|nr:endo-alpha-N-acetylgalactosaminidase family protein [Sumerlaeia bacterium]